MGCMHSKGCIGHVHNSPRELPKTRRDMKGMAVKSTHSTSSDEEDGGDGAHMHELGIYRDSDVAINRLSRVSSQFLPPEGSKTVRVPLGNYELRYSFLSQRGFYPEALDKANQDSFCIHTPFGTNPNDHFFGVFDGHGEFGAQCSQFVKRKLCENLLRNSRFHIDAVEAIHSSFLATNSQLHDDALDDSMSGTTAVTILVRGRTLYVANSGDSRAVIAESRGKDIVAVDLSVDQTPFRSDELERVKHCGARVLTLDQIEGLKNPDVQCWGREEDDDGDPPRLWVQNGMYPGTAFTRSIGDSVAESIGVVGAPEIYTFELTANHPFFVIASDGVFEFLSSQSVVEMVAKYKDPRDACAAIVAESYRLWLQYETRTDDITIIVVHITGLDKVRQTADAQNAPSKPLPLVLEETGSESPFPATWNTNNHRVRHDLSRTRLKVIESSLENGHSWFPPPASHRKTWEEEAHIDRVLHDHFLFRRLTDTQCQVLLDCMQKVEVKPGDVVVEQGGEGDCFYVITNGEFEVLATQEEGMEVVTKILHQYTAEKLSSFGELALMYNKPLQASVRAVTDGTLWALKRGDFRGILTSEFSNIALLKLLRSVESFSSLTILQLSCIAESLVEISFSDGQKIIDKDESLCGLYIIQKGLVRLSYLPDASSPIASHIFSSDLEQRAKIQDNNEYVMELTEGSHFGEWILLGESVVSLSASSVGEVVCLIITKEKFDSAVESVLKLPLEDRRLKDSLSSSKETILNNDASTCKNITASDLGVEKSIYATDCESFGFIYFCNSDTVQSLMTFSKRKVHGLGKEELVLKEKKILISFSG
ncbi:Protein phosphatase 2C and cyclic nucleotide-binding/kinase domain-containing protein [Platanthera guangdongensis]|uniref:protein-serine/threonine phosphatase n=1 Tax=Platanthera guangdongensis TaxID=2320717 RepID=A0ABR2N3N9_9ASPA